jgi:hypothetical protein
MHHRPNPVAKALVRMSASRGLSALVGNTVT